MNRLFCSLQPFDMVQQIYTVDNNGNIIDTFSCTFDDMIEAVPSYCKNNNINIIHLLGITDYTFEMKRRMMEFCKTNYAYENLNLIIDCGEEK